MSFCYCFPSKIAFMFFRLDLRIPRCPRCSTHTCCCCFCCCCQSYFHRFGEDPGRWRNELLVLTLTYYFFWGTETTDKYLLCHNLFETAVSISHFVHEPFLKKGKNHLKRVYKLFCEIGDFFCNSALFIYHF